VPVQQPWRCHLPTAAPDWCHQFKLDLISTLLAIVSQQVLNNIAEQQTFLAAELQRLTAFKTAGMQQLDSSAACAVTAAAGASHAVQSYHHHQLDQQPHRLPGNYCCRLMAAATEEQWQQVAHMTPHVITQKQTTSLALLWL
jgi:hypothetical protein